MLDLLQHIMYNYKSNKQPVPDRTRNERNEMNNLIRLFNDDSPKPKKPRGNKQRRLKNLLGWHDAALKSNSEYIHQKALEIDISQFNDMTDAQLHAVMKLVAVAFNRACQEQRDWYKKQRGE